MHRQGRRAASRYQRGRDMHEGEEDAETGDMRDAETGDMRDAGRGDMRDGERDDRRDGERDDRRDSGRGDLRGARVTSIGRQQRVESWWETMRKQGDEGKSAMRDWVWTNVGVPLQEKVSDAKIHIKAALRSAVLEVNKIVENTMATLVEGRTGNARREQRPPQRLEDVNIWEEFFGVMMTCVDLSLCEGWLIPEDVNEPFFQLGMPASAVAEIALRSPSSSCTEIGSATITPEDLMMEEFEDIRDLIEEVQKVKREIARVRPNEEEQEFIRRSAICAGGKEVPSAISSDRRRELNAVLACVQRVAIKLTQKSFYKEQAEAIMEQIALRDRLSHNGKVRVSLA
ncbi:hypothetical protein GUITHDRAFT_105482 [Guillardia theta CCMP2712]|uniref:Uncharacterized protein n=1 Tax=Guillardia theta (strain CCMP2712) TaxID=905079 RepID=L1JK20_GUITC|nr:hypothetical protein GUITHDRAFT_105482 [Guillardia theta CCMP2712]EKX48858.1 hypothetical protein GUITHDRAFT_105482 [Guillardia theta CCMP2712]|eukprot:XP_005835838.1 hypothetical protein GUITHDRAFT_105482 [Guillardia theta CCMP2712]